MKLPEMSVKNFTTHKPMVQGGMGVYVSGYPLAGAVSREGGLGVISSAGLRDIVSLRENEKVSTYIAVRKEIEMAQDLAGPGNPIGINIMWALRNTYQDTIRAAIDAGVDAIISGAGLPTDLPTIQKPGKTALIPIVSSHRALRAILKRWEERAGYRPDAVVLEGPKAGGHLGFKMNEIDDPEFSLEKILPPVLEMAHQHGDFPVIVAGGIYDHSDIVKFLAMGAKGVQMGTRFLATIESSATQEYKQAVVGATEADIHVVCPEDGPASPCGLPFRILKCSPMYSASREAQCNRGYLLHKGSCEAMQGKPNNSKYFCICNGLLSSAGYAPEEPALYTVGTNAYRVDKILSVADLMAELRGE